VKRSRLKTDAQRAALMRRVRRSGTPPERIVREVASEIGLRYRCNVKSLPGSPDLANKRGRWAIFANGCFWHHHKGCKLGTHPARNAKFWADKFAANRARDARKVRELRALGFEVLVVWQCQTADRKRLFARLSKLGESSAVEAA
jgi:DNA mismatch endonuclease, patch repair protein